MGLENIALAAGHLRKMLISAGVCRRRCVVYGVALHFGNFWTPGGVVAVRNYISFLHLEI